MKLFSNHILKGVLLCFLLGFVQQEQASAQFTITEDFRGSGSPNIIIGDNAYLTSGVADPVGAGWLRLTTDDGNQKGYAYINKSFPSTLGVLIDFEYTMWRSRDDNTYKGADGLSIFLFDASYGPGSFALGAYGGSLGYANSTASTPPSAGLTGGYLGIGFDSYGNFVRHSEGKNGGSTNVSPNSIALRGPTTSTSPSSTTTNKYLKGVTIFPDGSTQDALNMAGDPAQNVIDYNRTTAARPIPDSFYRRVQIEITPTGTGTYNIVVRWTKTPGGSFTDLINYTTMDAPPTKLKLGFAASTGGGFNYHEIRNLLVTTPGNLRIVKRADKDILRTVPDGHQANEITYTIQVVNSTNADLSNIQFEDSLTDANGNLISPSMFTISGIGYSGFLPGTSLPATSSDNLFTGSLNLAANTTGIITVTGTLSAVPAGNSLVNTAHVMPTDIQDQDLENNTSTVATPVISEQSDLVISQTADQSCLDSTNGNTFTVTVSNMGALSIGYSSTTPLTVTDTIPTGSTLTYISNIGWSAANNGNVYTFTKTGTDSLSTGMSLPPISYTITNSSPFSNNVQVKSDAEEPANVGANNQSDYTIKWQPAAPTLPTGVSSPITYYVGEVAQPLSAEATAGNTLNWYLNPGGIPSNIPFTPSTATAGTTSYWVSQTNGHCESALTEIQVQVIAVPTITGTVYNDINGLTDNQIDDGSGVNGLSNLWVVAVNQSTHKVVEATAVSQFDGTYTLGLMTNATYNLILISASTPPATGDAAPPASLPVNWTNTGENLGAGIGDDGTVDGILEVNFTGSDITDANFGIRYIKPAVINPQLYNPAKDNGN